MTEFGNELTAYEGNEPYIFISYAHKDSDRVLPILARMQKEGYRLWFDRGIEAGTEWPEYIEEHLIASECVLVFLSASAIDSKNCRHEINLAQDDALDEEKKMLAVYLEETELRRGMRLQLGSVQSLFAYRHPNDESFLRELCGAKILEGCKGEKYGKGLDFYSIRGGSERSVIGNREKLGEKVIIPDQFENAPVTQILDQAFAGCESIREITLPKCLRRIGTDAFEGCSGISEIRIPNSVAVIACGAFRDCTALRCFLVDAENRFYESIDGVLFQRGGETLVIYPEGKTGKEYEVPENVRKISDMAFRFCRSPEQITLPTGLAEIGQAAFAYCTGLTEMILPFGIKEIPKLAFTRCAELRKITVPASVEEIGSSAFSSCVALADLNFLGTVAEWAKIRKARDWCYRVPATVVHCADGDAPI